LGKVESATLVAVFRAAATDREIRLVATAGRARVRRFNGVPARLASRAAKLGCSSVKTAFRSAARSSAEMAAVID
jgi:hypothetical protein